MAFRDIFIRIVIGIAALTVGITVTLAILARVVKSPANLGVRGGQLAPCPSSPNCVSTQAQDERHRIAPIPYTTSTDEARERMLRVIRSMARTQVITQAVDYIHVEFQTQGLIRYVDDVEFYFDEEGQVIHFRSASRLPYWDWGVNRKRMEEIRTAFETEE